MKLWPLKSKNRNIPIESEPGSFWENRGDRQHCGVDLYTESGNDVFSIEDGIVISVEIMTSPKLIHYWNDTYQVIIQNANKNYWKYGEMSDILVKEGDHINTGQKLGKVGLVLNVNEINDTSPLYIQKLKTKNPSMLHLELFSEDPISKHKLYLGGNWFGNTKPKQLLNPTDYLKKIDRKINY